MAYNDERTNGRTGRRTCALLNSPSLPLPPATFLMIEWFCPAIAIFRVVENTSGGMRNVIPIAAALKVKCIVKYLLCARARALIPPPPPGCAVFFPFPLFIIGRRVARSAIYCALIDRMTRVCFTVICAFFREKNLRDLRDQTPR